MTLCPVTGTHANRAPEERRFAGGADYCHRRVLAAFAAIVAKSSGRKVQRRRATALDLRLVKHRRATCAAFAAYVAAWSRVCSAPLSSVWCGADASPTK